MNPRINRVFFEIVKRAIRHCSFIIIQYIFLRNFEKERMIKFWKYLTVLIKKKRNPFFLIDQ